MSLKVAAAASSAELVLQAEFGFSETHGFHDGRKTPLCAEESFAVEATPFVDVSVQNVHTDHAGVHGVGILLHSSLGHRFPRVAVDATQKILEIAFWKENKKLFFRRNFVLNA